MNKIHLFQKRSIALAAGALLSLGAQAMTFETEDVRGNFDSTITIGTGIRTKAPGCSQIVAGASGNGAPAGCLAPTSLLGDQGNLNYAKGDAFTTYLKGSHELLLKLPSDVTFLGRVNWMKDFTASDTTGYLSATTPPAPAG